MALTDQDKERLCDPQQTSTEDFMAAMKQENREHYIARLQRFVAYLRASGVRVEPATVDSSTSWSVAREKLLDQVIAEFVEGELS